MKAFPFFLVALFAFCICAYAADKNMESQDRPAVPEKPVAIKGSKKTVMFPHNKGHENIECVICHHLVDGKPTWLKCANSGCHDNLTEKKGVNSLYFVMHSRNKDLAHQTCMNCHLQEVEKKQDLKKKLTGCSESACHPGKKEAASEKAS